VNGDKYIEHAPRNNSLLMYGDRSVERLTVRGCSRQSPTTQNSITSNDCE